MTTYGHYRDDMVQALSALLSGPPDETLPRAELERVLECRDSLLHSLRRQLELATAVGELARLNLAALAAEPVRPLRTMLAAIPDAGPGRAPTEVLIGRSDDRFVESWRQAARASLLATDVLDSTQVWRTKPDVQWAVVADAAAAAASLSVLDDDLTRMVGSTDPDLTRQLCQTNRRGLGLTAALVLQVATSGPLSSTLARLSRPEPTTLRTRAVSRLGDTADGQQRLAEMLRLRQGSLPASSLGPVLVGQARIAHALANAALRLAGHAERRTAPFDAGALAAALDARAHALTQLARAHVGVADLLTPDPAVVWQTGEVLRAVERHEHSTTDHDLDERTIADIAHQTDHVYRLLVRGIDRAFSAGQYLVPAPRTTAVTWHRPEPGTITPLLRAADAADRVPSLPLPAPSEPQPDSAAVPSGVLEQLIATRLPGRPLQPGMRRHQPLIR